MKSSIKKSTYQAIYRLLNRVSPISSDCGRLCGSACCIPGDDNMVIYMLPGEEKLFSRKEDWLKWDWDQAELYEFPDSWHGRVYTVRCTDPPNCLREMRPLQCRTFPLAPYLNEDGELSLILYPQKTPYVCPLVQGEVPLDPRFVKATYTVWQHLIRDPLIRDLVELDSRAMRHPDHPAY
ncbi:MAG: hypothetical protein ACOX4I_06815 [Anaerovoracaceae bacterium]|jgi:Fe-S-cluster containining protein